jgi:WD40 repeat protein
MKGIRQGFSLAVILTLSGAATAQQAPTWAKDVKPFLAKYCLECHKGAKGKGGLDVSTHESFLKGGISFPGFEPGKPDESFALKLTEHKAKPIMPPSKSKQPTADEKKMFRAWIVAGGKADGTEKKTSLPDIKPKTGAPAPISALAYRPDGKLLAAGGYREVVLLDPRKQEITAKLGEQSAAVTALAFANEGHRLAVASGSTGTAGEIRLYTATNGQIDPKPERVWIAHGDIIYDLTFSPDGKVLASTGYDRLIKLWNVASGNEIRTLKDHSDTVYGLAFSPDGKLLASAAADRAVKVWDIASGRRLYTLADATDWVYAVAWSPDGKHLAAAGVDRSIRVWEVDAESGRLVRSAFAHEGPVIRLVYSGDGAVLYSLSEDRSIKAWEAAKLTEKKVYAKQPETVLALAVSPDHAQLALGRYDGALVLLDEPTGKVQGQPLPKAAKQPSDRFEPLNKKPGNDTPATAQLIELSATIVGAIDRAGAVDFYRFEAKTNQEVGVQAVVADAKTFDPIVQLTDEAGKLLAEGPGLLGHVCRQPGTCYLSIRDREFRGGGLGYRLNVGEVPVVTAVFPLGLQRGSEGGVDLLGVNLGDTRSVMVQVPANAAVGSRIPLAVKTPHGPPLGNVSVAVGEFPGPMPGSVGAPPIRGRLPVPGTADGAIRASTPDDKQESADYWQFAAKKGERLVVEVEARRLGTQLDSFIEILDARDQPVARATLRCVARTYSTFRDHDSQTPGIRLETWNELATDDYLYVGSELMRIQALPRHPDDDCRFFSVNNQRVGFLDTTPTHHPQGAPMYKVSLHPPGTTFPPNGFPVVTLFYRNDDGGAAYGKDSRLFFDPPETGDYRVRVSDARGQGGKQHGYRLTVRPPRPNFQLRFSPTSPTVWRGGAVPITVTADRIDGFDGPIEIRPENLPPGFSAPRTSISAGETTTAFALFAEANAPEPDKSPNLKLIGAASIAEREVLAEATGSKPQLAPPGEIVATVEKDEISVQPGKSVKLTVNIERRNGFKGRVPLDVRGLPHGVRVLDIGLNGILITEAVSSRTLEIYCEPWVKPTEHPFVVLGRREGKNTEHAAKSVLLKVVK